MTCDPCSTASAFPDHRMFNPACLACGARLLRSIGRLEIPRQQRVQRQTWVLNHWQAHGHGREQLRAAAMALPPTGQAASSASDAPASTKRRSAGRRST